MPGVTVRSTRLHSRADLELHSLRQAFETCLRAGLVPLEGNEPLSYLATNFPITQCALWPSMPSVISPSF